MDLTHHQAEDKPFLLLQTTDPFKISKDACRRVSLAMKQREQKTSGSRFCMKQTDFLMAQKLTMAKEDTGTDFLTSQKLTMAEDTGTDFLTPQKDNKKIAHPTRKTL